MTLGKSSHLVFGATIGGITGAIFVYLLEIPAWTALAVLFYTFVGALSSWITFREREFLLSEENQNSDAIKDSSQHDQPLGLHPERVVERTSKS